MSRKRVPLNQNECTADFRIGVPFEQNLQTGLSRGFFYKNNTIRSQLDSALYNQQSKEWKQTVVPEDKESKQTIISLKREVLKEKEMSKELAIRNREISEENQILREKIEKMEKQIKQKTVSILKKL